MSVIGISAFGFGGSPTSRSLVIQLVTLLLPLLGIGCASDAPFNLKERREIAFENSVIRNAFRNSQATADAAHANGTLLIIQQTDIAARREAPSLLPGPTPATALLALPPATRNALASNGLCVWIVKTGVATPPARVPCADELQKADLLSRADELSLRSRGLAIEFDRFQQSATFLTEGLANTIALVKTMEARVTTSEELLAISNDSSTKANQTLLALTDATRNAISALKSANVDLEHKIDDLVGRVNGLK